MNEFTREELQYFFMIMKPFHFLWRNDPLELEKKIQSMIDNYCDHCASGGEVEIFVDTCHKCDAYLLRETHHDN